MNFNYVCELKTANGMAGTMAFGDLLENCTRQRLLDQYNAPEYECVQLLHELSGLYSEAYENTALFFGEEPVEVRFFGVPGRRRGRFHAQRRDEVRGWALLPVFRRR